MSRRVPTPTLTNVASSASSVAIVGNTGASRRLIWNDSTATLYLTYGTTAASTSNYTAQVPSQSLHDTAFGGPIQGIWASANGAARVTELI